VGVTPRAAILVVACALVGLASPLGGVVLLAVALVVIGADASRARMVPPIDRMVPSVLARGVPAPIEIRSSPGLTLRQPGTADVTVDLVAGETGADGALRGTITAERRGRHALPPAVVRAEGPLGLGRWSRRVLGPAEFTVYPDVLTARRLASSVRAGRLADASGSRLGPTGLGTAFEALREYQPDDDLRLVNWRATARLGRAISNQFRVEQSQNVVLALDAGRLLLAPTGGRVRMDLAVDSVAAVAYAADALGDRVGLVVFDAALRGAIPPRQSGGKAVVEAVVGVEAAPVDSDYELAFRAVGTKRSLILVFTDLLDDAAIRPLVAAVPVVSRRHQLVIVTAVDEEVTAAARSLPQDAAAAFEEVVAQDLLAARARAVFQLRRVGAVVVEAPGRRLPAACLGAYLNAKTLARI